MAIFDKYIGSELNSSSTTRSSLSLPTIYFSTTLLSCLCLYHFQIHSLSISVLAIHPTPFITTAALPADYFAIAALLFGKSRRSVWKEESTWQGSSYITWWGRQLQIRRQTLESFVHCFLCFQESRTPRRRFVIRFQPSFRALYWRFCHGSDLQCICITFDCKLIPVLSTPLLEVSIPFFAPSSGKMVILVYQLL
jgi:hypothetical protein